MPFPEHASKPSQGTGRAGGKQSDLDWDFEGTLDRIGKLEGDLSMNMQSAKLLREENRREEASLKRDKEEYERLVESARGQKETGRRQSSRLHPIAQRVAEAEDDEEHKEDEHVGQRVANEADDAGSSWRQKKKARKIALTNEEISKDPKLDALVKQLRPHLASMQGNVAGLEGLRKELDPASQAVREMAWKMLPEWQYRKVVGLPVS